MRSVLNYLEKPDEVLRGIRNSLYPGGTFIHSCFCFPDDESRLFYKEVDSYFSSKAIRGKAGRKMLSAEDVESITSAQFGNAEITGRYRIRADNDYVIKRFGISAEDAAHFSRGVLPALLKKYPNARQSLSVSSKRGSFLMDAPYYIMKAVSPDSLSPRSSPSSPCPSSSAAPKGCRRT